jgi:hypothetical protein
MDGPDARADVEDGQAVDAPVGAAAQALDQPAGRCVRSVAPVLLRIAPGGALAELVADGTRAARPADRARTVRLAVRGIATLVGVAQARTSWRMNRT